jgi:hypothetical protein
MIGTKLEMKKKDLFKRTNSFTPRLDDFGHMDDVDNIGHADLRMRRSIQLEGRDKAHTRVADCTLRVFEGRGYTGDNADESTTPMGTRTPTAAGTGAPSSPTPSELNSPRKLPTQVSKQASIVQPRPTQGYSQTQNTQGTGI